MAIPLGKRGETAAQRDARWDKFVKKELWKQSLHKAQIRKRKNRKKHKSRKHRAQLPAHFAAEIQRLRSLPLSGIPLHRELMRTAYWRWLKEQILSRDGYECVRCKGTTSLQAHHQTYLHYLSEWKHLNDMTTLCRACHYETHITFNIGRQRID